MRYRTISLSRKVSLVILPIDDFTEQVITGSKLRVYTEQGKHLSICKEDGYRVFCDLKGSTVQICAEGPLYQKQVVEFPIGGALNVFKLRMLPNASYPISRGTTSVRGCVNAGDRIRLFFPEQKKNYKLLYDYVPKEHKNNLSLFLPETVCLEGKIFYIQNKEGKGETFQVSVQTGEKIQLDKILQNTYKKIGTTIYPMYEVFAEADGRFFIPIRGLTEEENVCICNILQADGQKEWNKKLLIQAGKENNITKEVYEEEWV